MKEEGRPEETRIIGKLQKRSFFKRKTLFFVYKSVNCFLSLYHLEIRILHFYHKQRLVHA